MRLPACGGALEAALLSAITLLLLLASQRLNLFASARPIVDLTRGRSSWPLERVGWPAQQQHQRQFKWAPLAMLREPMPWEEGYFDPSYHPWPKPSRQQEAAEKAERKLHSSASASSASNRSGQLAASNSSRTQADHEHLQSDKDNASRAGPSKDKAARAID